MRFDNLQALEDLSKGDSLFLFADGATTMANPISNEYVEYVKTAIGICTNAFFQIQPKLGQVDFPNLATFSEINIGLTAENLSVAPESFGKLIISINLNPNSTNPNQDNIVKSSYFYLSIFDNAINNGVSINPALSIAENINLYQTYITGILGNLKSATTQQYLSAGTQIKAKYDSLNIPPRISTPSVMGYLPQSQISVPTSFYSVPMGTIVEVANVGKNGSVNWMVAPNLQTNDNGYREANVGEYRILNNIDAFKVRIEITKDINNVTRPIFMAGTATMSQTTPTQVDTTTPFDMLNELPTYNDFPVQEPMSMVKTETAITNQPTSNWKTLAIVAGVIAIGYYLIKKKIIKIK